MNDPYTTELAKIPDDLKYNVEERVAIAVDSGVPLQTATAQAIAWFKADNLRKLQNHISRNIPHP